jgi:hypothetical protein
LGVQQRKLGCFLSRAGCFTLKKLLSPQAFLSVVYTHSGLFACLCRRQVWERRFSWCSRAFCLSIGCHGCKGKRRMPKEYRRFLCCLPRISFSVQQGAREGRKIRQTHARAALLLRRPCARCSCGWLGSRNFTLSFTLNVLAPEAQA